MQETFRKCSADKKHKITLQERFPRGFERGLVRDSSPAARALHESSATVNLLLQSVSSSEAGNEQERRVTHTIVITVHFLPQDISSP